MTTNNPPVEAGGQAGAAAGHLHALPYVIAVTGHRDLDESQRDHLKREFSAVLELVLAALPNTPVRVLSALADGADRAFAEATLELRIRLARGPDGAEAERLSLAAPLPMPRQQFFETFGVPVSTGESMAEARAVNQIHRAC